MTSLTPDKSIENVTFWRLLFFSGLTLAMQYLLRYNRFEMLCHIQ